MQNQCNSLELVLEQRHAVIQSGAIFASAGKLKVLLHFTSVGKPVWLLEDNFLTGTLPKEQFANVAGGLAREGTYRCVVENFETVERKSYANQY